jgi:hypothetical protein
MQVFVPASPQWRSGMFRFVGKTSNMKTSFLIKGVLACCLLVFAANNAQSQCYKPKPLSATQTAIIKGVWKGTYLFNGETRSVTINIYTDAGNEVVCDVDTPPVAGEPDSHLYWFCDGGEFHLKKFIGNKTYSFQGTPVDGVIKGIMVIRENEKTAMNSKFRIQKVE